MTAEVAIINRHAVALAADSAMTIGQQRVWKHGNKIFSLGPTNDIAVMVYGAGEFNAVSWETIVKTFRDREVLGQYKTVRECHHALINFIPELQKNDHDVAVLSPFNVAETIFNRLEKNLKDANSLDDKTKYKAELDKGKKYLVENVDLLVGAPAKTEYRTRFGDAIYSLFDEKFSKYVRNPSGGLKGRLIDFCYEGYRRHYSSDNRTGIVVAGYGSEELFPAVYHETIDGCFDGFLRNWGAEEENLNLADASVASILVYAQADMARVFMEGVSPEVLDYTIMLTEAVLRDRSREMIKNYILDTDQRRVETEIQKRLNRESITKIREGVGGFTKSHSVDPITRVVQSLPKEEMANMAEALVEITTLKRKVGSPVESVGGPTDVLIISKGDGVVWTKRKHYFDADKNRDFGARKAIITERSNGQR